MRRQFVLACAALAVLGLASPALAEANCRAIGNGPDIGIGFEFHFGQPYTEDEINEFDLMTLRQMGVNAIRAERWGDCIRAYVRKPGGGTEMQFFNARTFEPVDSGPLNLRLP